MGTHASSVAGGATDAEVKKLAISTDAKWILGAFATGFLVLGGLILTVFSRLDTRIDALAADVARITADVARLLDLH